MNDSAAKMEMFATHDLIMAIFAANRTKTYNLNYMKEAKILAKKVGFTITKVNLSIKLLQSTGKRLDLLRAGTYFVDYDPKKHNFMQVRDSLEKVNLYTV